MAHVTLPASGSVERLGDVSSHTSSGGAWTGVPILVKAYHGWPSPLWRERGKEGSRVGGGAGAGG
jgi:hypothetical protein